VKVATRSWQFWVMWMSFGLAITGAYGILSSCSLMLIETYRSVVPHLITTTFIAGFVSAMGISNLSGRLFYPLLSDYLAKRIAIDPFYGRKLTYSIMWGLAPLFYLLIIGSIHITVNSNSPVLCLVLFTVSVYGILTSFGGAAATRPPLCGDLFGSKYVGIMTARQLSVVMPAAFIGPKVVGYFREKSIREAILDLTSKTDDSAFIKAFGAGKDQINLLIEKKTLTINRLLEILPSSVPDPTPFLYDRALLVLATLSSMAFLLNLSLKPVPPKYHEKQITEPTLVEKEIPKSESDPIKDIPKSVPLEPAK